MARRNVHDIQARNKLIPRWLYSERRLGVSGRAQPAEKFSLSVRVRHGAGCGFRWRKLWEDGTGRPRKQRGPIRDDVAWRGGGQKLAASPR